jgi:thiopurine S-methyltransferase
MRWKSCYTILPPEQGVYIMDAEFWHERWKKNEIPFHESKPNPLLIKYLSELSLDKGSRVFLPLCGKTLDIAWLLSQGYQVAGAELSEMAIEQLFKELGVEPTIVGIGAVDRWSAHNIDVFVGDIFALSRQMLGPVDAIYDRAALVALPEAIRRRYSAHLMQLTDNAPQLLICFDYDQRSMEGPPFSIKNEEIKRHYAADYDLTLVASTDVSGGLKGKCPAKENVWLLKNK